MARYRYAEILYNRRRQLRLSIPQAAKVLRMRESVLEAFEAGDFDHLPALGYAQGMVSSYARYLGLDSREISELYEREHAEYVAGVTGRAPSGLASLSDEPSYKGAASATNIIKPVSMTPPSLPSGQDDSTGMPRARYDYRSEYSSRGNSYVSRTQSGTSRYGQSVYPGYRGSQEQDRRYTRRDPNEPDRDRRAREAGYARRSRGDGESYGSSYGSSRYAGRGGNSRGRELPGGDVTTRRVNAGQYRDDLRFDSEARPYRPSSTRAGREGSRNVPTPERPNVKRRPQPNRSRDLRSRNNQPQASGFAGFIQAFTSDPRRVVALIAIALAVVLIIIISSPVRSCASSKNDNGKVDVVTAVTSDTAQAATTASTLEQQVLSDAAERKAASSAAAASQVTKVAVSVDEGATTWVEITCDGEQKVAESITGAWSEEYTVTKNIEIRVSDPSVVTVTKNGERQVFGSKSAGVSSVTIQGTDPSAATTASTTASAGSSDDDSDSSEE